MTFYLYFTVIFFAITAINSGREMRAHPVFKPVPMSGTLNAFLFVRFQLHHGERVSMNLWLFLLAHVNGLVCAILYFARALSA